MKNWMMCLTGLMMALAISSPQSSRAAQARIVSAVLSDVQVDENLSRRVISAELAIDFSARQVQLVLWHPSNCPADAFCIAMLPPPSRFELPLKKISKDSCGVVTYLGLNDARPVDGLLEQIVVRDFSESKCARDNAKPDTVVVFETLNQGRGTPVGGLRTRSRFSGGRLENALNR